MSISLFIEWTIAVRSALMGSTSTFALFSTEDDVNIFWSVAIIMLALNVVQYRRVVVLPGLPGAQQHPPALPLHSCGLCVAASPTVSCENIIQN